jgi:hypothetical protein
VADGVADGVKFRRAQTCRAQASPRWMQRCKCWRWDDVDIDGAAGKVGGKGEIRSSGREAMG